MKKLILRDEAIAAFGEAARYVGVPSPMPTLDMYQFRLYQRSGGFCEVCGKQQNFEAGYPSTPCEHYADYEPGGGVRDSWQRDYGKRCQECGRYPVHRLEIVERLKWRMQCDACHAVFIWERPDEFESRGINTEKRKRQLARP